MVKNTPDDLKYLSDVANEMQKRYNKGEVIPDEEIQNVADMAGITLEEAKKAFEEGKQADLKEPELNDEQELAEFQRKDAYYTKLAQDPNLTQDQAQEIADFYSITPEEVWGDRYEQTSIKQEPSGTTQIKKEVERSILRRILRFIRNLFR